MDNIVRKIYEDDEFLSCLLETEYYMWQKIYIEILVKIGNKNIPKDPPWKEIDIIYLVKDNISYTNFITSIIKHCNEGLDKQHIITERQLVDIGKKVFMNEGDFLMDFIKILDIYDDEFRIKTITNFNKFLNFVTFTNINEDSIKNFNTIFKDVSSSIENIIKKYIYPEMEIETSKSKVIEIFED